LRGRSAAAPALHPVTLIESSKGGLRAGPRHARPIYLGDAQDGGAGARAPLPGRGEW